MEKIVVDVLQDHTTYSDFQLNYRLPDKIRFIDESDSKHATNEVDNT